MTYRIRHVVSRIGVDERAIALPMALGIMMVVSIVLVSVLAFASSSERHSESSKADQVAVGVAEAGLNQAQSVLANADDATLSTALPSSASPATISVEGGTARYWGSLDTAPDPDRWTITSVSSVRNPTGAANVNHTVSAQFDVTFSGDAIGSNEAWNYVYSDAPGCTLYQNDVVISAPIYTKGDLCIKNLASMIGPKIDVYGGIQLQDSGRVGTATSDSSDPAVRSRLGCRNGDSGAFNSACSDGTYRVYRSSYSNAAPNLTKPVIDVAYWRANAKPGPNHPCTTSGGPVPSFTSTSAINLLPSLSYTCTVTDAGTTVGELSWNNSTKVLTVKGVIFFEGELVLDTTQTATYDGQAVIYIAKNVNIKNETKLCALTACPTVGWDPNTELLVLVTASPVVPAFELQNLAQFQGAAYAEGAFKIQNTATMHGPVIAGVVDAQNNGFPAAWPPLTSLLDGMPANPRSVGAPVVTYIQGSWRG